MVSSLPPMIIKVAKTNPVFVDWRDEVANGAQHPLQIEELTYTRCTVGKMRIDTSFNRVNPNGYGLSPQEHLEEHEQTALRNFLEDPVIAWAVDNSFDGIYVTKDTDHASMKTIFEFIVYLKEEHVTFWRLKFSGT